MSSRGAAARSRVAKKSSATKSQASKTSVSSKSQLSVSVQSSTSVRQVPKSKVVVSQPPKPKKEFTLPAYSTTRKVKVTETELDKLRKKTIRRNAPPGEDLKAIKEILKTTKGQGITVQEFIRLIGPSTGDNGECLRIVMNDDLACFRRLARKVYDMITQDNSDVLLNQQLQLCEYYKERKTLLNTKMMSLIEEIYGMAPSFDFDRFAAEGEAFLNEIIPIPEELKVEPEEMEMLKRQAAFHRLHWLKSEGERLHEENNSLKKRLTQMKKMHMEEQQKMVEMEKVAEAKRESLEAAQAEKQETLEILNQSLEKTIIKQEMSIRKAQENVTASEGPSKATGAFRKTKSKVGLKKKKPKWNEEAAAEIEARLIEEAHQSEVAKTRRCRKERSPFHFSPIKSPPKAAAPKELSPFHFSPPKSPPRAPRERSPPRTPPPIPPSGPKEKSPFHYSPSMPKKLRPAPFERPPPTEAPQQPAKGRRGNAPRDSWGGFY